MYKASIIINPALPTGLLANAVACITSGLFVEGNDLVGEEILGKDITFIPITKIPILILKPGKTPLVDLCRRAQKMSLKYMAFTKEAQTTTSYSEYRKRVEGKSIDAVTLMGLGFVGPEEQINSLTGNLPMLR
ncbi:DUF2000 domain-containing protein [Candidatus Gottesmanbacteria bacterium]|nr:DUF2000 domain-containing protein [Candidatus Gottesmanbacteria bacterium]